MRRRGGIRCRALRGLGVIAITLGSTISVDTLGRFGAPQLFVYLKGVPSFDDNQA
jgi:hypothetical protein